MSVNSVQRFYLLCEPEENKCVAEVNHNAPSTMEKIRCPLTPGHARGRRTSPLNVLVPCDPPPDVIFTWMSECLVAERVRRIFEGENLTGFSTVPANGVAKNTGAAIQIHELIVTGWGGIAPETSGIREVERCPGCGHLHYSPLQSPEKLVDSQSWDGSDFFMIWPLPRFRFVTGRVLEVFEKHRISGVTFSQTMPTSRNGSGYSPGRLSYYMPIERARLLGGASRID